MERLPFVDIIFWKIMVFHIYINLLEGILTVYISNRLTTLSLSTKYPKTLPSPQQPVGNQRLQPNAEAWHWDGHALVVVVLGWNIDNSASDCWYVVMVCYGYDLKFEAATEILTIVIVCTIQSLGSYSSQFLSHGHFNSRLNWVEVSWNRGTPKSSIYMNFP